MKKVAPHGSLRAGYGLVQSGARLGDQEIQPGFFINFKAGVSFNTGSVKLIPFGGVSIVRARSIYEITDGATSIINFGFMATFYRY